MKYAAKKTAMMLLTMVIVSFLAFLAFQIIPGDAAVNQLGSDATVEAVEALRHEMGLDRPFFVRYGEWVLGALRGDFGISYKYKTDVLEVIGGRAVNTLILGGIGFILIFSLALGLGIFCAWFEDRWPDRILCKVGTVVSCIPEFWLSLVLILVFAVNLRWLPSSGAYSVGNANDIGDRILHLILPLTVAVLNHLWYYAYMIRNKLLEEIRAEYVLLAKSKGLNKRQVMFRHCLRNIIPSYLSIMAISVPHILGGTYIIETVFSYPGIGTLSYESARYQDYNLLMVLCILSGAIVILFNLAAQIINERIDPRMKENELV